MTAQTTQKKTDPVSAKAKERKDPKAKEKATAVRVSTVGKVGHQSRDSW